MEGNFKVSLEIYGTTPQEAAEKLNRIVGVYSQSVSRPDLGTYNPDTLDNNWPTCRERFTAILEELERKNPLLTLDVIYEMTKREFYSQYGFVPHNLTPRYFLREARSVRRPKGRKPNVGVR